MARKPTPQQLYEELLAKHENAVAEAFAKAIGDITSTSELARIVRALEIGDIDTAIAALHLDPSAYGPLYEALRSAYLDGGQAGVETLPARDGQGARLVIRFDGRNPRAEAWLQEQSSSLVTRIVEDQRAAVRTALVAGMVRRENPRTTALDIVGRVNRATGKREGGVLGLSGPQEVASAAARAELASDDPALLRNYLTRARRDKRFDRSVKNAIAEGKPLPAEVAKKALTQYRGRLLKLRGETIGRTEALTSLHAAKHEAYLQAVDTGKVTEADIRRTWRSAGDKRVRDTHEALNGDTAGLREPFVSPSGAHLMFPGDPSAPAAEIIQCRCDVTYRIDFLSNLR